MSLQFLFQLNTCETARSLVEACRAGAQMLPADPKVPDLETARADLEDVVAHPDQIGIDLPWFPLSAGPKYCAGDEPYDAVSTRMAFAKMAAASSSQPQQQGALYDGLNKAAQATIDAAKKLASSSWGVLEWALLIAAVVAVVYVLRTLLATKEAFA